MKKAMLILPMLILALVLSSCGVQKLALEDFEWKMRTVMRNADAAGTDIDTDDFVYAVGEADELYPNARIIDLTLKADNGKITVTDATNGKEYYGTYKISAKTPKGTDYELVIDGISGYATVAPTEYYNGTSQPTLPINLGDYSLYFIPID